MMEPTKGQILGEELRQQHQRMVKRRGKVMRSGAYWLRIYANALRPFLKDNPAAKAEHDKLKALARRLTVLSKS